MDHKSISVSVNVKKNVQAENMDNSLHQTEVKLL